MTRYEIERLAMSLFQDDEFLKIRNSKALRGFGQPHPLRTWVSIPWSERVQYRTMATNLSKEPTA